MNAIELAALLNGREYGSELAEMEELQARKDGLLVIFGYSDDNIELRGAFRDEIGANNGRTLFLHRTGIIDRSEAEDCDRCRERLKEQADQCVAVPCLWNANGWSWWITPPSLPTVGTFEIYDGGEPYCRGLVLTVAELPMLSETGDLVALRSLAQAVKAYIGTADLSPKAVLPVVIALRNVEAEERRP
jgi:hypothetical protein